MLSGTSVLNPAGTCSFERRGPGILLLLCRKVPRLSKQRPLVIPLYPNRYVANILVDIT